MGPLASVGGAEVWGGILGKSRLFSLFPPLLGRRAARPIHAGQRPGPPRYLPRSEPGIGLLAASSSDRARRDRRPAVARACLPRQWDPWSANIPLWWQRCA